MKTQKKTTLIHNHPDSNGKAHYVELSATPLFDRDQNFIGIIESAKDITNEIYTNRELEEYKDRLHYQEHYSSLTGLPNRVLFFDRIDQAIKIHQESNKKFAVLFLDINNFKAINDSFGLNVGNEVLKFFAQTIAKVSSPDNSLSHFGADEFGLIVNDINDIHKLIDVVDRLLHLFDEPYMIHENKIYITFRIGIALYPNDSKQSEELLKNADSALHKAKRSGKNSYEFYTKRLTDMAIKRIILENDLREAIQKGELFALFQPQVETKTQKVAGSEALVRWQHKKLGLISPDQFIPMAEEIGLVYEIDLWMINHTTQKLMQWYAKGYNAGYISINASIKTLQHPNFKKKIIEILKKNNCPAHYVELEVTESHIMSDPEAIITILKDLKDLGIQIAIDDFGTGYSSLAYLKRLPIDKLKIDKSFIDDVPGSSEDEAIVKTIIMLADTLKLRVIAEGVEETTQKDFLMANGCHYIQGYYYYKPLQEEQLVALL